METGFAATPECVVRRALELAEVGRDSVVFDVGAGDGRIAVEAKLRGARRAVAIEIQPHLQRLIKWNAGRASVDVEIVGEDARRINYENATHVFYSLRQERELEEDRKSVV